MKRSLISSRSTEHLLVEALLHFEAGQLIESEFGFESLLEGLQCFSSTALPVLEYFADNTDILC